MLVLTRRVGESVVIGHDVVVTVLEVRGDVVKVGITAPRDIEVDRLEVFEDRRARDAVPGDSTGRLSERAVRVDPPVRRRGRAPRRRARR